MSVRCGRENDKEKNIVKIIGHEKVTEMRKDERVPSYSAKNEKFASKPFTKKKVHQESILYMSVPYHYENTPIQIYRTFHLQKLKIFR